MKSAKELVYRFSPKPQNCSSICVDLVISGYPKSSYLELCLPDKFGPNTNLQQTIEHIHIVQDQVEWVIDNQSQKVIIYPNNLDTLNLQYTLSDITKINKSSIYDCFKPIIAKEYFQINGYSSFIYPEEFQDWIVTIDTIPLTEFWPYLSSSFHLQSALHFKFMHISDLLDTMIIGQKHPIHAIGQQYPSVLLSIFGNHEHVWLAKLSKSLINALSLLNRFWKDKHMHHLFTLNCDQLLFPSPKDTSYIIGSSFNKVTVAFISKEISLQDTVRLFYHELIHQWIGGKIKMSSADDDFRYLWFSEGFTDYLTLKLLLINELISFQDWTQIVAEEYIDPHYQHSRNSLSNVELSENFLHDPDLQKLPYRRGLIFALLLEIKISEASNQQKGIRELLIACLNHFSGNFTFDDDREFFTKEATMLTNLDVKGLYQRHIENGIPIDIRYFSNNLKSAKTSRNTNHLLRLNAQTIEQALRTF